MHIPNFKIKSINVYTFIFLLILSLYFGRFNINIGFSLKPFMIVSFMLFIFGVNKLKYSKLYLFEMLMVLFIFYHSLTALNFKYPESSIRFIILYLIIFFYYFVTRGAIANTDFGKLERIISITGLIGVTTSILYYLAGVITVNFNFFGNNLDFYGLMLDRSMPRLTGTVSGDPNIFVFYVTLYFFYTLTRLNTKINRIGFLISSIAIVLTLSRGAYISIIIGLIAWLILSKSKNNKIKFSLLIVFGGVILFILQEQFEVDFINYISARFSGLASDGGTGRIGLWTNAFRAFMDNPMGIGINSTVQYNIETYSRGAYTHNSFLEILAETGIVGFVIYICFWGSLFIHSLKLYKLDNKNLFLLLTIIAMFVQMNALSVIYNEFLYFVVVLLYKYSFGIKSKSVN